jgi:hypothetical protein
MKDEKNNALKTQFYYTHRCKKKGALLRPQWERVESNHRHKDFQSFALPTELRSRLSGAKILGFNN